MNDRSQDFELLRKFARRGDQEAFAAVVRRHLDLLYATALRKSEDPGAAEEIAQNVFAALARKAWRFAPDDSLPTWLYRTALLESKLWLRGELRRRRREQAAAELGTIMKLPDERSALRALMPLLDEALLSLREKDRAALLLRYYESRSLREVGASLGVSEDAAQKRVAGALEQLSNFFQRRGFKTATVAATAAALQHTAASAPAFVCVSVIQAAMAAAPPVLAGLTALLARLVSLTQAQKAIVALALVAAPALWHWNEVRLAERKAELERAEVRTAAVVQEAPRENAQTLMRNERPAYQQSQALPQPAQVQNPPQQVETEVHVRAIVELPEFKVVLLHVYHHFPDKPNAPAYVTRHIVREGESWDDQSIRSAYLRVEVSQVNAQNGQVVLRENGSEQIRQIDNWARFQPNAGEAQVSICFPEPDFDDLVDFYAQLIGRTALCHPYISWPAKRSAVSIMAYAPDTAAVATFFEGTLRDNGVRSILDGERFVLLVPGNLAESVSATVRRRRPQAAESQDSLTAGAINMKNVDLGQALQIYGALIGRQLIQDSRSSPHGNVSFHTQTALSKSEAIYAFDTLFAWQGLKAVLVGNQQFKVVAVSGGR